MVELQTVEQSLEDFRLAMLRTVKGRGDHEEVRRAVNELMQITYRLHERLRAESQPYRRAIEADQVGETVPALGDVRAAGQHRSVQAFARFTLYPSHALAPDPRLAPGDNWEWLPTEDIEDHLLNPGRPVTERQRAKDRLALARYQRRLAGHTVLQTFDVAGDTFRAVAAS